MPGYASADDGTVDVYRTPPVFRAFQFIESLCLITTIRSITTDALCT